MQTIDINALYLAIKSQLTSLAIEKTPELLAALQESTDNAQNRLLPLQAAWAAGDVDDEFVLKQLSDEGNVLNAELLSYSVFGQSVAQEARDQTIQTIVTTILAILMQVITKI